MSARIAPPARPGRTPRLPRPTLPVVTTAGLRFHLVENLLEARRGSWLPTNGAGPDEDVNIYLALRLDELATGRQFVQAQRQVDVHVFVGPGAVGGQPAAAPCLEQVLDQVETQSGRRHHGQGGPREARRATGACRGRDAG